MNQTVNLWLRAANPFAPPRGMAEAQRAAKVGALALVIGAVQGLATVPLMPGRMTLVNDMMAQGADIPAESQAFTEALVMAMTPMMMIGVVAFSFLYLVLAVVQWRKMTWVIPVTMLAILGYSLLSAVSGFLMLGGGAARLYTGVTIVQWIIMLATVFVYVAAFRGGRMLDRLKRSA
ncbi:MULTISPECIES: hypothetical protein [unclassified Brevundimonas]|uniref:hypothetical protein n=1 Tax=unclassified Brevundimonas TaxID=2622653 RepID=UPI0025C5A046|nr:MULTISPECIES: hypothetical protein [unclassified Brevundimonas]